VVSPATTQRWPAGLCLPDQREADLDLAMLAQNIQDQVRALARRRDRADEQTGATRRFFMKRQRIRCILPLDSLPS